MGEFQWESSWKYHVTARGSRTAMVKRLGQRRWEWSTYAHNVEGYEQSTAGYSATLARAKQAAERAILDAEKDV